MGPDNYLKYGKADGTFWSFGLGTNGTLVPAAPARAVALAVRLDRIDVPPVQSRKRGKCMSRRTGQNPKVRVKKRSNGQKVFYFQ